MQPEQTDALKNAIINFGVVHDEEGGVYLGYRPCGDSIEFLYQDRYGDKHYVAALV